MGAVVEPIPGVAKEDGDFKNSRIAFSIDAISTMIGSVFGLSPVTSFIESGAGVMAGGRTGLTAIAVGLYFGLSIFFAPVFASIPPWATGGALVVVGSMMFQNLAKVQWKKFDHALTAFVTVLLMPLTYSIAWGIVGGLMVWIFLQISFWILSKLGCEREFADDKDGEVEGASSETTDEDKEKKCPSRREIRRKESPKRSKVCTTNALHKDHSLLFGSYTIHTHTYMHTYCTTYVSPVNKKNVNKREA